MRIILVAGKGGVGKTTSAAATGLAAARHGHRTLVLSFDLAHSLSDSFNLDEGLWAKHRGQPVQVAENLEIQEIDVQEELERQWADVYRFSAALFAGGGLDEVVAEEVAIMPGMEDIVALIRLNEYVSQNRYDVIVLDCPPTSEALRFVSITASIDWYVRRRLKMDRQLAKFVRPWATKLSETARLTIPDDDYFNTLEQLFARLNGVDELLRNPSITTVRLVTNPEKMVIRETQRAFMYFCMYSITTDLVIINRLLPQGKGYFENWAKSQAEYSEEIVSHFAPVPTARVPLMASEVVGLEKLEKLSQILYADKDPAAFLVNAPSYGFSKQGEGEYRLQIRLPFAPTDQLEVSRAHEDLLVRIGTFKRNILLPRAIIPLKTIGAAIESNTLVVRFAKEVS
ncbi:MAG TPA: TRC40/GET3/ArsA family transport-energizing ATPase [Terracidiphilus sp.]|nr:TRC40/GET3/ArsA family transport-energizing ATPase [Terracidiphilus sp.]